MAGNRAGLGEYLLGQVGDVGRFGEHGCHRGLGEHVDVANELAHAVEFVDRERTGRVDLVR